MNRMDMEKKIHSLLIDNEKDQAELVFNQWAQQNDEPITGIIWWGNLCMKNQFWGKAINAFQRVLELDEQNREARVHLEMVNAVLAYTHTDSYNP